MRTAFLCYIGLGAGRDRHWSGLRQSKYYRTWGRIAARECGDSGKTNRRWSSRLLLSSTYPDGPDIPELGSGTLNTGLLGGFDPDRLRGLAEHHRLTTLERNRSLLCQSQLRRNDLRPDSNSGKTRITK